MRSYLITSHFIVLLLALMSQAALEYTNIQCKIFTPDFCHFEYCYIKAINRTYKYISLKVKLHKLPVTNATFAIALFKRANGYKPFLYNFSVDACKFFRAPHAMPVVNYFYQQFAGYSNINHTCPYDHDILLEKMTAHGLGYSYDEMLPVPKGEYAINTLWTAYNVLRAQVKVFFKLT